MGLAGPLADVVFEPAMRNTQSGMAQSFGWLVGVGPGAGMALILIATAIGATLVGLAGYLFTPIREAETLLPDHDALPVR